MSSPAKALFQDTLQLLVQNPVSADAIQQADTAFRDGFLAFGSETPDNLACVEEVGVGVLPQCNHGPAGISGFVFRKSGYAASDIMNRAEGIPIPEEILQEFPELNQKAWDAVFRLAAMLLLALETDELDVAST